MVELDTEKRNKIYNIVKSFNSSSDCYYANLADIDGIARNCIDILNQKYYTEQDSNFSTNYTINESINIIKIFLKSIDPNLEVQFSNIIAMIDANGKPFVHFINADKSYYKKFPEELNDSIKKELELNSRASSDGIYIHLEHNLYDLITIIHEMFHEINSIRLEIDGIEYTTPSNYLLTESVSILSEKMLACYLFKNNYINQNDCNLILNRRLKSSKRIAAKLLLEIIYIKMIQKGIELNYNSVIEFMDDYFKSIQAFPNLLEYKKSLKEITDEILKNGRLDFDVYNSYVQGQIVANGLNYDEEGIKNLLDLNNKAGSSIEFYNIYR